MHKSVTVKNAFIAAAAILATCPAEAAPDAVAVTTPDAAAAFGAREAVLQISLSPDGTHVAIIGPTKGRGAALLIADLVKGGAAKPIMQTSGDPERLTDCHWSSNTRLICGIYMISPEVGKPEFSRLVSVASDGSGIRLMSARTNSRSLDRMQYGGEVIDWLPDDGSGKVLMTRTFVPETSIGTNIYSDREGLGVEQVDSSGPQRSTVIQPRARAVDYITDGHGAVRAMGMAQASSGYLSGQIDYFYRGKSSNDWKPLGSVKQTGTGLVIGFNPIAIDRDLNLIYGFDDQDGRRALYSVALDGSMKKDLVLANPSVDVDGLIRVGRQRRVVGASFVTDRRQGEFFDPELRKLRVALGKALPGQPLVTFVDASADEDALLLYAGSDNDAGHYYVYHKKTRNLEDVLSVREQLSGIKLATVKPITFPAADGTQIPGYLTLPPGSDGKNIPAIVMPHGGPGARDEWGFDWLAQFFANRGFAVLQPNFRGSTGYGETWFQKNGFQSWRTAIGDVNDAGRWLVKQGIAPANKLAIVGWSYGGYAALQSAVLDPDLFKAIVAIAPVTDLDSLRQESLNYTSYKLIDAYIGHGPHVVQGSPARNAARIKAPVLLFHGNFDRNVGVGESRLMADKLKASGGKVELVEFKGLDHQLDDNEARTAMLGKADAFLRTSLGM